MKIFYTSVSGKKFLVTLVLLFCLVAATGAEAAGDIAIYLNGTKVKSDVSPFIDKNSRTMVPLRFIAEGMGAYVDWAMGTQVVTIKHEGMLILLTIGSSNALVDGKTVTLDTHPVIAGGRTMVPLRFVGEQLGCTVSWNQKEQAVYITTKDNNGDNNNNNDNDNDGKDNPKEEIKEELVVRVSSYANIRQGPGTAYPVLTQVRNGTVLGSIGSSGGWYKVLLADNSTGWISGTIVTPKNSDDQDPSEVPEKPGFIIDGDSVIFIADAVNIRSGPSVSYEVIGQAYKGLELAVLAEDQDWIKVRTTDGKTGWVASWLVAYKKEPAGGSKASLKGKVVVIDPGHGTLQSGGWTDPGAVSPSGLHERDIVTRIAFTAGEYLSERGATVVYTRKGATSISLAGRAQVANDLGADVFVSIHCNSSTNPGANGSSTYYYAPETMSFAQRAARERLASCVQDELVKALGRKNLGILQANFAVLRHTYVPSILVETAFLSNWEEEALLRTSDFQIRAGEAVAKGIIEYFN